MLADQTGPLEDGDVLLDRREAHRVVLRQLSHALIAVNRPAHNVAPGGVAQCTKDAVVVEEHLHIYNHMVVLKPCQAVCPPEPHLTIAITSIGDSPSDLSCHTHHPIDA